MLWLMHDLASQHGAPGDEVPHGGSGQETCVQCKMDNDTSQGDGGDTLVPHRDSEGRGGIEMGLVVNEKHPGTC